MRAFLLPYYDLVTEEIRRHGGVVDKLLGDGVMAVFGAPVAHEDDPERAVRMAGRCLVALDRGIEAGAVLHRARELFSRLGAVAALAEVEALLAGPDATA